MGDKVSQAAYRFEANICLDIPQSETHFDSSNHGKGTERNVVTVKRSQCMGEQYAKDHY